MHYSVCFMIQYRPMTKNVSARDCVLLWICSESTVTVVVIGWRHLVFLNAVDSRWWTYGWHCPCRRFL